MKFNILMFIFGVCVFQIPLLLFPFVALGKSDRFLKWSVAIYEMVVVLLCSSLFYYFQFIKERPCFT